MERIGGTGGMPFEGIFTSHSGKNNVQVLS